MEIYINVLLGILFFGTIGRYLFINRKRELVVKDFASYIAVLQFHMEKAYDIIHKDQILVYSLEATTLPDEQYNKASFDFVRLVEKLLGPSMRKEMLFLYGDYDTFAFNLVEYFNKRYEDDEIRKGSIREVMESGDEPERA